MVEKEITQRLKLLKAGNVDHLRGPYSSDTLACLAIPNVVDADTETNFRDGKFVEIGSNGNYITKWWGEGDYSDGGLKPYSLTPTNNYFWSYLSKANAISLLDKLLLQSSGSGKYANVNDLVNLINASVGSGIEASVAPGSVLPAPASNKIMILASGSYTQPGSGGATLTAPANYFNVAVFDVAASRWDLVTSIPVQADVRTVSGSITNQGSGPLDKLMGPYATIGDANAAIQNAVDPATGGNYRAGKTVLIGTPENNDAYSWQGSFADESLRKLALYTIVAGGKNRINLNDLTPGTTKALASASGDEIANTDAKITGYIPVVAGKTYTISGITLSSDTHYVTTVYNALHAKVAYFVGAANKTFQAPAGATFVRTNLRVNGVGDPTAAQLEEGAIATAFESYKPKIQTAFGVDAYARTSSDLLLVNGNITMAGYRFLQLGDYVHETDAISVLSAKKVFVYSTPGKNRINLNDLTQGTTKALASASGDEIANTDAKITGYIPVVAGVRYQASGFILSSNTHNVFVFYDANKIKISFLVGAENRNHTTPANAAFVRFNIRVNGVGTYTNAQYEEGDAATAFESYYETIVRKNVDKVFSPSRSNLFSVVDNLDFSGHKGTNVADPASDGDIVPLRYLKNNGVKAKNTGSINLINFSTGITVDAIIARTSGLPQAAVGQGAYATVPIVAGQTYNFSGITLASDTHYVFSFYDASNVYIANSVIFGASNFVHTAPANAAFVKFNVKVNGTPTDYSTAFYTKGSTVIPPSYVLSTYDDTEIPTGNNIKLVKSGYENRSLTINGIPAKIITSDGYDYKGAPDRLMIICHGNGQNETSIPHATWMAKARANKVSIALIRLQDTTTPTPSGTGYNTNATGWGNDITLQRVKDLYRYCQTYYNFEVGVVLCGQSMGLITAMLLAYMKAFPVTDVASVGGVQNGPAGMLTNALTDARRNSIRAAHGLKNDGSDDVNVASFTVGNDNWLMGLKVVNGVDYKDLPFRLFIMMGEETGTYTVEFGGSAFTTRMLTAIRNAGGYVKYFGVPDLGHADPTLYNYGSDQGFWSKIFNIANW